MNSSSTRSIAMGGAAAAAQPGDVPPPGYAPAPVIGGEVVAFGLWFALIVVALTISGESGVPNSPT